MIRVHYNSMKPGRLLLLSACAVFGLAACGSSPKPSSIPDLYAVPHPEFHFSWFAPASVTAEAVTSPAAWVFWKNEESFAGAAWITQLDDFRQDETIDHARLWKRLQRDEAALLVARGLLAPEGGSTITLRAIRDAEGRDRLGLPTVARLYELNFASSARPLDVVVDWLARTLGGRGRIGNTETPASSFQVVLGLTVLHNGLGVALRTDQDRRLGVYGVWAVVPNRINEATDFLVEGLEMAQTMPYGSAFARVSDVTDDLRRASENETIAALYVVDPMLIDDDERPNIKSRLLATMTAAVQPGISMRVAMLRSCDTAFATSGLASEAFVASDSPGFEAELSARLDLVLDADNCDVNQLYRAAATAGIQAGASWDQARQRWLLFLSKRNDVSPCVAVPQEACTAEEIFDSIPDDVRIDIVAPIRTTCSANDLRASVLVPSLGGVVEQEGGRSHEYCSDWHTVLSETFASRASQLSGLILSHTPHPGTLRIQREGVLLAPGTATGYTYDRASGAVLPGELATFTEDDVWRATYRAIAEPKP